MRASVILLAKFTSENLPREVKFKGVGDPGANHFADGQLLTTDKYLAVNLRGVVLTTAHIDIVSSVVGFDQDLQVPTDMPLLPLVRSLPLHSPEPLGTRVLMLRRKVIRQSGSRCALLLGIGEYPQPIELHLLDKAEQVLKVFLRLSGKAHNERRTDRHIRDATADLLNQGQDIPLSVR